jgi:putative zinc finger protein
MRNLNCKSMTKLLPLYVVGDLAGEPVPEARLHLAGCEGCRKLAEEFLESHNLLTQAYAQPEFDAEFYAGIRRAVLGKIPNETVVSTKPWPFEGRWGRRWIYATSLAVAVIAVITLQILRGAPPQTPVNLVATPQVAGQPTSVKNADSSAPGSLLATRSQTRQQDRGLLAKESSRNIKAIKLARKPDVPDIATAQEVRREIAPAITLSGRSEPSPRTPYSADVSRIEIQTADPNIRIIWLMPREPRKSDETINNQVPHESGEEE